MIYSDFTHIILNSFAYVLLSKWGLVLSYVSIVLILLFTDQVKLLFKFVIFFFVHRYHSDDNTSVGPYHISGRSCVRHHIGHYRPHYSRHYNVMDR